MSLPLSEYLALYFGLQPADAEAIAACFKPIDIERQQFFLKAGQFSDRIGFLQTGLVREFASTEKADITKWITTPGYFLLDVSGFFFGQPARWNMQALTDCSLQILDKLAYQSLVDTNSKWLGLQSQLIARCFSVLEDRVVSHLALTAEERFDAFSAHYGYLFNQVPLQYLASLLGMTPETMSRIRHRKAEKTS